MAEVIIVVAVAEAVRSVPAHAVEEGEVLRVAFDWPFFFCFVMNCILFGIRRLKVAVIVTILKTNYFC